MSVHGDTTPLRDRRPRADSWSTSTYHAQHTTVTSQHTDLNEPLFGNHITHQSDDCSHTIQPSSLTLGVYLVSAVFVAVANNITWKVTVDRFKSTDSTHNLEMYVNQSTAILYVALCAVVLLQRIYAGHITQANYTFSRRKFAGMGLLDAIASLGSAVGCSLTSGIVQTLCFQAAIPSTMIISRLLLNIRYSRYQCIGAALIVIGAVSAAVPAGIRDNDGGSTTVLGLIVLAGCIIPFTLNNVYKESSLKSEGLDVYYLATCVCAFQVVIGVAFVPLLSLSVMGGVSMTQVPQYFADGWSCTMGRYVENYDCHVGQPPYIPLLLFVVVNFAYTILLLLITKHGSAVLLVISGALALPLTNLMFTQSILMGDRAESFSFYDLTGLVVVVGGFLLYSLAPKVEPDGEVMPLTAAGGHIVYVAGESGGRRSHMQRKHNSDEFDTVDNVSVKI